MTGEPQPYNPLDIESIARSVETTLLEQEPQALPIGETFAGSGIYLLYYQGDFPDYMPISSFECEVPVYVGKAVSPGARQGKVDRNRDSRQLFNRLREHSRSIELAENLEVDDFRCRFLVVEDFFIPLGERLTIRHFRPVWNQVVDGFGNHAPGSGRSNMQRPDWDTLHPGRGWASKLKPGNSGDSIVERVALHFSDGTNVAPCSATR